MNLQLVTAYLPWANAGPYSMFQQHLHYYAENNIINNLIAQYDKDVSKLIAYYMDNGDQVLIMINESKNFTKSRTGSFWHTMEALELNELILTQHSSLPSPPTRTPGSHTINIIFGTPAIDILKGWHFPFLGFSDHWISLVDIQWDSTLGLFQKFNGQLHVTFNAMIPAL